MVHDSFWTTVKIIVFQYNCSSLIKGVAFCNSPFVKRDAGNRL